MVEKVTDVKSACKFVKDGWAMVNKYGWHGKTVHPYGYPIAVTKILYDMYDYGKCTRGSQHYLNSLANGLVDILNAWEARELEEKVDMIFNGKTVKVCKSDVEIYEIAGARRCIA